MTKKEGGSNFNDPCLIHVHFSRLSWPCFIFCNQNPNRSRTHELTAGLPCLEPKSVLNMDVETRIKWTYWKNLKAFTVPPPLVKRSRKSSSLTSCLWDRDKDNIQPPNAETPVLPSEQGIPQLASLRDVGEVEGGGGREDVLEVL